MGHLIAEENLARHLQAASHRSPPSKRQRTTTVRFANPDAGKILRNQKQYYNSRQRSPRKQNIAMNLKSRQASVGLVASDSEDSSDGNDTYEYYQVLFRPLIPNRSETLNKVIELLDNNKMPICCAMPKDNGKHGLIFQVDHGQAIPFEGTVWHGLIDVRKIHNYGGLENMSDIQASPLLPTSQLEVEAVQRWRERKGIKQNAKPESHEFLILKQNTDPAQEMTAKAAVNTVTIGGNT